MPYIKYTDEQKQRAAEVDLEELLRRRGEKLIRSGRDKRLASDHSVTVNGNEWFDWATREGGGPVTFVQRFYGLGYPEAMSLLLDGEQGQVFPAAAQKEPEPRKPFKMPPINKDMRRVYAYLLKQRCIDRAVISHFAREGTLYEDAEYHNAVFAGKDENGVFRHAHKRSANSYGRAFRINVESSDPRYSFHHLGTDRTLYVFEAPIDMLSYISLHPEDWQAHSYVSCCGTTSSPVLKMLERMGEPEELHNVILCLDNDAAGREASQRIALDALQQFRILPDQRVPEHKDWNDDLRALCAEPEPAVAGMSMGMG